jgi:probable phosphoglycerate mutase
VPLSDRGRRRAEAIGRWLNGRVVSAWTSPLSRARETCRLAGYADSARVEPDLREWDYGVYEGRTTQNIRQEIPDWSVWLSPIVDGESLEQLGERAQRVVNRVLAAGSADVALFAHGHILRVLAACWIELPPISGRLLALDTACVSILGYERETRVIRLWNFQPPDWGG